MLRASSLGLKCRVHLSSRLSGQSCAHFVFRAGSTLGSRSVIAQGPLTEDHPTDSHGGSSFSITSFPENARAEGATSLNRHPAQSALGSGCTIPDGVEGAHVNPTQFPDQASHQPAPDFGATDQSPAYPDQNTTQDSTRPEFEDSWSVSLTADYSPEAPEEEGESLEITSQSTTSEHSPSSTPDGVFGIARVNLPLEHRELVEILATTDSLLEAWRAYERLLSLPQHPSYNLVYVRCLHRLARLIARIRPRTRPVFIRFLSVTSTIRSLGFQLYLWEWNVLIDLAGRGWRKTKEEDFKNALDIYNDMAPRRAPMATRLYPQWDPALSDGATTPTVNGPSPDIITYTTLLNIALRTSYEPAIQHALSLLQSSGLSPNRITLLVYLRYYTRLGHLLGIRQVIAQMEQNQFDLGTDGANGYLWAYGRNGRLDIASAIYTVLRSRTTNHSDEASEAAAKYLREEEKICIPEGVMPDKITYTALIQAYSYHGYLTRCLNAFKDFVMAMQTLGDDGQCHNFMDQMLPIYRAIFLGFARHSLPQQPPHLENTGDGEHFQPSSWNLEALDTLFANFLAIPADIRPSPRTIWWILVAFTRTSGNDKEKLRQVFTQLRQRFPGNWGGRLKALEMELFTH